MTAEIVSRYPLTGVRSATTALQEALVARAVEVLRADGRVLAAYLVGGFAVGLGDPFSDVDLHCIIADDAADDLAGSWRELAERIAPTVSAQPFRRTIGGVCITPDWLHFDLALHPRGTIDPHEIEGMIPLLDKADLLPEHPTPRPDGRGEPFFPEPAVQFFLYMLGNVVSAAGRNEPVPLSNGVVMMRDIGLVGLLLAEQGLTGVPPGRPPNPLNPFPFTKRLRPYLTDEQHALLQSLPPVQAMIDSAIDGCVALARAFLPRAHALADATGATYPIDYERASIHHFEQGIGMDLLTR